MNITTTRTHSIIGQAIMGSALILSVFIMWVMTSAMTSMTFNPTSSGNDYNVSSHETT